MSKIVATLTFDHIAVVDVKPGTPAIVGRVAGIEESAGEISFTVDLDPNIHPEVHKFIEKEPRAIRFIKVPKEIKSIIIIP